MAIDADPRAVGPTQASALGVRAEYRFGIVLVLLLMTFMFLSLGVTASWARPVTVLLQGATLIAALAAARVRPRLRRIALIVTAACFVGSLAAIPWCGRAPSSGVAFLNMLLVAGSPVAIAWSIVRRRVIDVQTVLGALCVYVLLGMFWAFLFTGVGGAGSKPFFAQQGSATSAEYLYFSFVTLTTVGYGDLSAAGNLGRAFAVLEALFGQIYLVTVVALLVSNLGGRRRDAVPGR